MHGLVISRIDSDIHLYFSFLTISATHIQEWHKLLYALPFPLCCNKCLAIYFTLNDVIKEQNTYILWLLEMYLHLCSAGGSLAVRKYRVWSTSLPQDSWVYWFDNHMKIRHRKSNRKHGWCNLKLIQSYYIP